MVGFGRGPLSLVSQLGPSRFSYCLTSYLSPTPSRLYFGVFANLNSTNTSSGSPVQSTPFVINPALPNMYFLSVNGISLGTKRLPIDPLVFAINDDGTGRVRTLLSRGRTGAPRRPHCRYVGSVPEKGGGPGHRGEDEDDHFSRDVELLPEKKTSSLQQPRRRAAADGERGRPRAVQRDADCRRGAC